MKILFCFLTMLAASAAHAQHSSASIKGNVDFLEYNDTIKVQLHKNQLFNGDTDFNTIYVLPQKGKFTVNIPISYNARYMSLIFPYKGRNNSGKMNLYNYLIAPGDMIEYFFTNSLSFSGQGSKKWAIQKRLDGISWQENRDSKSLDAHFRHIDMALRSKLNLLAENKKVLGTDISKQMMADCIGLSWIMKLQASRTTTYSKVDTAWLHRYKHATTDSYFNRTDSATILPHSSTYSEGIIARYRLDSCIMTGKTFSVTACYRFLREKYSASLRDRLLTTLLYDRRMVNEDLSGCIKDAIQICGSETLRNVLTDLQKSTQINIHRYVLTDSTGKLIPLSTFKGKKIIMDFWFTGCPPCKAMAQKLREIEVGLTSEKVVLLSVNTDKNKAVWKHSIKAGEYTTNQSINLNTNGMGIEHPLSEALAVSRFPTLIVFDESGNRMRNPLEPISDNGNDLLKLLTEE